MKAKTKSKIRIFLLAFALFYSIFMFVPQAANASVSSIAHGQICEPDNGGVSSGFNLARCINNIYIFAIAIAGFVGVLMFVLAGYYYIQGSSESISEAKHILGSTLMSFVILFGTYLLLNTIDPNLTKIPPIVAPSVNCDSSGANVNSNCADLTLTDLNGNPDTNGVGSDGKATGAATVQPPANNNNLPAGSKTIQPCVNCINLKDGIPLHTKESVAYLSLDLTNVLLATNHAFYSDPSRLATEDWRITEAWPPTVNHVSTCHFNGTCADIAIIRPPGKSDTDMLNAIKLLCTSAKSAGLKIVNEYFDMNPNLFSGSDCPVPKKYPTTTAGHLHVAIDPSLLDPNDIETSQ